MQNKICLTMIVKDCAKGLQTALESVEGFYDFLSITDTGSSDDTLEVAKQHNAIISHYQLPEGWSKPYIDSFAKARNLALLHVPKDCKWISWLDSDDTFINSLALREIVLKTKIRMNLKHSFLVSYLNQNFSPTRPRVWSNDCFYWIGRVHEELVYNGRKPILHDYTVNIQNEFWVEHNERSAEDEQRHFDRDIYLLKLAIEESNDDPRWLYQLATHLQVNNQQLEEARRIYLQIFNTKAVGNFYKAKACYKLAVLAFTRQDFPECIEFCLESQKYPLQIEDMMWKQSNLMFRNTVNRMLEKISEVI